MLRASDKKLRLGDPLSFVTQPPLFLPGDDRGALAISSLSNWGLGAGVSNGLTVGGSWPAAERAIFVPIRVPVGVTVYKLVTASGSGAGANIDLGIYDGAGTRIVSSGSFARVASVENVADIADTYLTPGLYYLALALDAGNQIVIAGATQIAYSKLCGLRQMASAFPLPSTATFASVTSGYLPGIAAYLRPE